MILEAIVTTLGPGGAVNVAPMGPRVEPSGLARFVLRPYPTSTTCANLARSGEGVLHVVDDVLLLARAALGRADDAATVPAETVRGAILAGCCRYAEFRVVARDDRDDRIAFACEAVAEGTRREFFGLNRAKHAVVEAAILATRVAFLPAESIRADLDRLAILVDKTGGPSEREAFAMLAEHVEAAQGRGATQ